MNGSLQGGSPPTPPRLQPPDGATERPPGSGAAPVDAPLLPPALRTRGSAPSQLTAPRRARTQPAGAPGLRRSRAPRDAAPRGAAGAGAGAGRGPPALSRLSRPADPGGKAAPPPAKPPDPRTCL